MQEVTEALSTQGEYITDFYNVSSYIASVKNCSPHISSLWRVCMLQSICAVPNWPSSPGVKG